MKTLTTIFLLLLTISQAHADTKNNPEKNLKEYDIEIIVFEDAHARYINSEIWHKNIHDGSEPLTESKATVVIAKNLKKPGLSKAERMLYKTIKPVILNKEYRRINNSSEYNVLLYSAWRQTGLEKSKAFEININELNNNHKSKSENSITGHFKVVLSRYLHFYSQLDYQRQGDQTVENLTPDVNKADILTVGNNIYPMKNHRRMRSKELHYIDHPLIGILIQINPVKKPEKEL